MSDVELNTQSNNGNAVIKTLSSNCRCVDEQICRQRIAECKSEEKRDGTWYIVRYKSSPLVNANGNKELTVLTMIIFPF